MKRQIILFLACLLPNYVFGGELLISVKYPNGVPAQGIKVREVQLERAEHKNHILGLTDKDGEIRATIITEPERISKDETGIYVYAYRYVVMPDDYRWEISDIYWNVYPKNEAPDYEKFLAGYKAQNWTLGKLVKIGKNDILRWDVVLKKGNTVRVSLRDQYDNPIRNSRLSIYLDLQKNSHTGFGGEINISKATTDDNGNYTLKNAGDFYYSFDLVNQSRYSTPDVDSFEAVVMHRFQRTEDVLHYHKCIEKKITIKVFEKGSNKPINQAQIIGVVKFPSAIQGGPLGPDAVTDAKGIYSSDNFCTEHMVEFGASKEGFEPSLISIDQFTSGKTFEFYLEPNNGISSKQKH